MGKTGQNYFNYLKKPWTNVKTNTNNDENVHRFTLNALRGKHLERERERETGRERDRERERERERERVSKK